VSTISKLKNSSKIPTSRQRTTLPIHDYALCQKYKVGRGQLIIRGCVVTSGFVSGHHPKNGKIETQQAEKNSPHYHLSQLKYLYNIF